MKNCKNCNTLFEPLTPHQLYCSDKCYSIFTKNKKKQLYKLKKEKLIVKQKFSNCKNCNKEFEAKTNQKFCCKECYRQYRNKSRRKPIKIVLKPVSNINPIQTSKYPIKLQYNGVLIEIQKLNNLYSWKATLRTGKTLTSATNFSSSLEAIKDAKLAF